MKLSTSYIVMTDDECDTHRTESMNKAYQWFRDCVAAECGVRVFKMDFDAETNAFETASEITGDFADTLQGVA